MKHINRNYNIVDQAISLNLDFDKSRMEGFTTIRLKLFEKSLKENVLQVRLCAKQLSLDNIELENLQMYHPETKDVKTYPNKVQIKHLNYPSPEKQLSIIQRHLNSIPKSTFAIKEMTKKIFKEENDGFVKLNIELTEKAIKKLTSLWTKEYSLYLTCKIKFSVDEPIAGGVFLKNSDNQPYFLKDNKIAYSRCLFPCLDSIEDYYKISKLRVAVNRPDYQIFGYGLGKVVSKTETMKVIDFDINKVINPAYICLISGPFHVVKIPVAPSKNSKLNLQPKLSKMMSKAGDQLNTQEEDKFVNFYCMGEDTKFKLERKVNDYSNYFKVLRDFEENKIKLDQTYAYDCQWIFLENQFNYDITDMANFEYEYNFDSLFFYKTMILDSSIMIDESVKDTFLFIQTEMIRRFSCMVHLEKIALRSINDFWVFTGICSFLADVFMMQNSSDSFNLTIMEKKRKQFYYYAKNGMDINPLTNSNFSHPMEVLADKCFLVKSNLILVMIYAFLKLNKNNASDFGSILLNDDYMTYDKQGAPLLDKFKYTDTTKFFKIIKTAFGVKNLKSELSQYLNQTGTCEIDCAYIYNRKDNKMKLSLRQTPIHLAYFKKTMEHRFDLEKFFNIQSPVKKLFEEFEASLIDLAKHSDGFVNLENIKDFLSADGRILINEKRRCLKYLQGKFDVIVTETNDIEFREDIYDIRVEDVQDQEINFYMRSKFRRIVQKKGYDTDNFEMGQDGNINKTGPGLIGGAPYLWIKLDPYNHYLRQIVVRDGENILLAQLDKDLKDMLDLMNIYRILESLVTAGTDAAVNKLCGILVSKKVTNQLLKIQMIDTLTKVKIRNSESKITDTLIRLIKTLKFDNDNSLKENDFNDNDQPYYLINHLISELSKFERKCKKHRIDENLNKSSKLNSSFNRIKINPQTNESVVSTLLTLLQKNDNSQNSYNDTYYQANILKSLFRCLNLANFNSIIKEVNRFLKIEYFTQHEQKYLIKTIFEDFLVFVTNHYDHLGINLSSSNVKFYNNPALNKFPVLVEALDNLKKLSKRHKCDILLARSVFRMKLHIKKKVKMLKPWEIFIWAMKYIEKIRTKANSSVVHTILSDFVKYVQTNRKIFQDMQKPLSVQSLKLFNNVLFGFITSPYACLDAKFHILSLELYRIIYSDFLPICYAQDTPDHSFKFDNNWLSFKYELNFLKSVSNEEKMITLNYLNLHKRKKAITGPLGKVQGSSKYNIRDLIFQNFKFNKEPFTWKNLCKQIVGVLLSERDTAIIEQELAEEIDNGKITDEKVKVSILFIKWRFSNQFLGDSKTQGSEEKTG